MCHSNMADGTKTEQEFGLECIFCMYHSFVSDYYQPVICLYSTPRL